MTLDLGLVFELPLLLALSFLVFGIRLALRGIELHLLRSVLITSPCREFSLCLGVALAIRIPRTVILYFAIPIPFLIATPIPSNPNLRQNRFPILRHTL